MTGLEKCAVFLLSVGERTAAQIMRHLDEGTVNNISVTMASIRRMRKEDAEAVLTEFLDGVDNQPSRSVNSFQYVREVLDEALGEHGAASVMEYIMRGGSMAQTMDIMRDADPAILAEQMRTERPQAVALLLAHLDPASGSELLTHLPDELADDVLYRYARLDSIQPHVLRELGGMLSEQLSGQAGTHQLSGIGGPRKAADMLNNLPASTTEKLLNNVSRRDADLVDSIRENMFTFTDLVRIDSRALQTLMREVSSQELVAALKASPPEVVDKMLANLSTRAAESVKEDLDSGPPVRRSDAENAQKSILRVARQLDREGQINISKDEDLL